MPQVYRYAPSRFFRFAVPSLVFAFGLGLTAYTYFAYRTESQDFTATFVILGATLILTWIFYWRYTQVVEVLPDRVILYRSGKPTHEFLFDRCVFRAMMGNNKNPLNPGMDCTLVVRRDGQMGEKHPLYLPRQQFREVFAVITSMQLNYTGGVEPDGVNPVEPAPQRAVDFAATKKQIPARTFLVYPERAVGFIHKSRRIVSWYMPGILGLAVALLLHELPGDYAQPPLMALVGGIVVFLVAVFLQQLATRFLINQSATNAPKKILLDSQGITIDGRKLPFADIKQIIATPATTSNDKLAPRQMRIVMSNGDALHYNLGLRDDDEKEKTSTLPGYSHLIASLHKALSDTPGAFMFYL